MNTPGYKIVGCIAALAFLLIVGKELFFQPEETRCFSTGGGAAYKTLGEAEIIDLKQKAKAGHGESALDLSGYYGHIGDNFQQAAYWEKVAAEDGAPEGMYRYGTSLVQDDDPQKKAEGRDWLKKAAGDGCYSQVCGPAPSAKKP